MAHRRVRTQVGRRTVVGAMAVIGAALVIAGCGGSSSSSSSTTTAGSGTTPAAAPVTISTQTLPGLGPVLVNAQGHTLYMFVPDKQGKVTCVGSCAAVWPPVVVANGQKAVAAGAVKASLLGSVANPNPGGGQVVTYNKWPLYTYVPDTAKGDHDGQALNVNGGLWYVLSPAGAVIKAKVAG